MARYHIGRGGKPGICRATKACPFGGDADHFSSKEEAQKFLEKKYSEMYSPYRGDSRNSSGSRDRDGLLVLKQMQRSGMTVEEVKDVRTHDFSFPESGSTVDVLEDRPDPDLMAKIRQGKIRAFER